MKERRLGKTSLRVSEIGFGCWPIGGGSYGPVRDEDSLLALETAWESGVNFFDTADVYGEGHSEELLGKFIKTKSRDQAVIATKAGWDFSGGLHKKDFSPAYLRSACEKSLRRLQVDTIDLFQLHNPSREILQRKEAMQTLEALKKEGKIRFIGVSVHAEAEAFAALQDSRVHALQIIFNLLDQRMAERILPEADKRSIGLIVREPLASGLLSGKYPPFHEFSKDDHRRRWLPAKREADWKKIQKVQEVLGVGPRSLTKKALEFILSFDMVSTVIPGAKTREQVLENVSAALAPELEPEEVTQLEALYAQDAIFQEGLNPR